MNMMKRRYKLIFVVLVVCVIFLSAGFTAYGQDTTNDQVTSPATEQQTTVNANDAESSDADVPYTMPRWAYYVFFLVAPIAAILALLVSFKFTTWLKKKDPGNERMKEIAGYVKEGAYAYLKRQFTVVTIFFIVGIGVFYLLSLFNLQNDLVPWVFLTGGFFSGLSGFIGMKTATNASNRTAAGAKNSLNDGLQVAFRAGAVMGLTVVGLGLLMISLWFLGCKFILHLSDRVTTMALLGFGIGASAQALFARVGGGIFTKAADVGADLVGKVEAGIPEDDPRNPATIADNVGDNVGDVAGMGADLYESYCNSILAAMVLGIAAGYGLVGIVLPMIIAGVGILLSILGIGFVKTKENATQKDLLKALSRGINISSAGIIVISFVFIVLLLGVLGPKSVSIMQSIGVWLSIVMGLVAGLIIGKSSEYYTSSHFKPTIGVAEQAKTSPATVIIEGLSVGLKSTGIPILAVGIAILLSYGFAGGFADATRGLFGISFAAIGMLSTLGITLSTDAYGPIADNAGGNAEMSELEPVVRERTDALDALGNTTAATGKGFAIGSAALTAMALIAAYIEAVKQGMVRMDLAVSSIGGIPADPAAWNFNNFVDYFKVNLMNPRVLVGLFIGSAVAFIFCALTMKAVGRAAQKMVDEVRRQFREITGIMEGQNKPDYAQCVNIATKAAQREMILPSALALLMPIIIGVTLGVAGVIGLLIGALASGFVLAIFMANAGGSWDNAKKYIEEGNFGGKGSDAHKASVVGDTIGDPFKDTSGPTLNILIKLMSVVSIIFAGLTLLVYPKFANFIVKLFSFVK